MSMYGASMNGLNSGFNDMVTSPLPSQQQQDIPPDVLEALMRTNTHDERQRLLQQQQGYANSLRQTPMPEGREHGGFMGGVYAHASPLETLGAVGQRAAGGYQTGQLQGQQLGNLNQQGLDIGKIAPLLFALGGM